MPKVIAMEMVSNAEVLSFIQQKRKEYKLQAIEDAKAGSKLTPRPSNLLQSLDQHQEHLESDHYPYTKNPSAYGNAGIIKTLPGIIELANHESSEMLAEQKFNSIFAARIVFPAVKAKAAAERERLGRDLTSEEKDRIVDQVDRERTFSETERLMVINHAPTCLEILQPMIENIEARYSDDEQAYIVEAIQEAFRPDELAAAPAEADAMEVE